MKPHIRTLAGLCLLAVLSGCRLTGGTAPTPDAAVFDDDTFVRIVEETARPLCDRGQARTAEELAGELDRHVTLKLTLPPPATQSLEPAVLYARRAPGVLVLARLAKCDHCPYWHIRVTATAFALTADGVCVSCRHFFDSDASQRVVAIGHDGRAAAVTEILGASADDDLAVFRVAATGLTPLPLRTGLPTGSPVAVIAHPSRHYYLFTWGHIARRCLRVRHQHGAPEPHAPHVETLEVTAEFGSGSSGAPVLDACGNAVGVALLTTSVFPDSGRESGPQMVLRACAPAESVLRLLRGGTSETPP